jgi:hypothetical protein
MNRILTRTSRAAKLAELIFSHRELAKENQNVNGRATTKGQLVSPLDPGRLAIIYRACMAGVSNEDEARIKLDIDTALNKVLSRHRNAT